MDFPLIILPCLHKINEQRKGFSMNYTYILKCSDGSLYTGWTNDIVKRLEAHRSGKGAKYTKGRGPLELVYLERWDTKSEAMRREAYIKSLSKAQKLDLLASSDWKEKLDQWGLEGLKL
jgi:putative endonuclease